MTPPLNFVDLEKNRITLSFEPDPDRIKAMRLIAAHHGGAKINTAGGVWRLALPLAAKDDIATHFSLIPWSDAFRALTRGAGAKFQTSEDAITRRLLAAAGDLSAPLEDGRTLYEHQRSGIEFLLKTPRSILADDMGLGKTIMSLLAARAVYNATKAQTVVITKACLIEDWREEAAKLKHRVVSVYSWAKIPKPSPGVHYVLIADECHFAQNLASNRGKAFMAWAMVADFVFLLTGTPLMNGRHSNIFPLLKAIKHPIADDQKEYEAKFCGAKRITLGHFKIDDTNFRISWTCKGCGHYNDQKWHFRWQSYTCGCGRKEAAPRTFKDTKGATNAPELRAAIAPFMLRRLKSECLDLPPKTRIVRQVDITPDMHRLYTESVQRAKAAYQERIRNGEVGENDALAMLSFVRVAASVAKVEAAIELAEEAIGEGSQPVIFTEFLDSANAIAAHFKVKPYTGDLPRDQKVQMVKDFQANRQTKFVGTREAGGTGLTLTASNVVIAVDRPMRPGDIEQAEDRLNRIGQKWPVSAYWLRAFPVCLKIDQFIETKQKAIEALLLGKENGESGEQISARQVLLSLF